MKGEILCRHLPELQCLSSSNVSVPVILKESGVASLHVSPWHSLVLDELVCLHVLLSALKEMATFL